MLMNAIRPLGRLKRKSVGILLMSSAAINILSLALPVTLMQVYDRIIAQRAASTLIWLILGCTVALSLEAALRIARSRMSSWMAARYAHQSSTDMVRRILDGRLEDLMKDDVGTHVDRLSAVNTLQSLYAGPLFQVLLDVPFAVLFLGAIWYVAGALVAYPVALIGLYLIIIFGLRQAFENARDSQIGVNTRRVGFVMDMLSRIHLIKSMALEEQILRTYERLQSDGAVANMKVGLMTILPTNLGRLFSQLAMFGTIVIGGTLVITGDLTVGVLTACTMLSARAMSPIQNIARFWLRFSEARIALRKIEEVDRIAPEISKDSPSLPDDIRGSVEFERVTFRYEDDGPELLSDLSIRIPPRQTVAVVADVARSSTTFCRLITGALKPTQGTVLVDSYSIAEWNHTDLRGKIAYIPQDGTLFRGTILENLALFDRNSSVAAMDAASLLGLDELVSDLPLGYETLVEDQSNSILPSGLIRRICIARELVHRPRIFLCDRIDSAMDHDTLQAFSCLIEHLRGQCTVILVTNQNRLLRLADKVYRLSRGELIEQATT